MGRGGGRGVWRGGNGGLSCVLTEGVSVPEVPSLTFPRYLSDSYMGLYQSVCVCVCVLMFVCVCSCMCPHVCVFMCLFVCTHVCVFICVYSYLCVHV